MVSVRLSETGSLQMNGRGSCSILAWSLLNVHENANPCGQLGVKKVTDIVKKTFRSTGENFLQSMKIQNFCFLL